MGEGRQALLIVDMQWGQLAQPVYDYDGLRARIGCLRFIALAAGAPVFHVRHDGAAGGAFAPGSEGWRFLPGMEPLPGEATVAKRHGSAFHDTDLDVRLRAAGVGRLVVVGMKTQYCIDAACRAAAALGYDVTLVRDGHSCADTPELSAERIIAHHNSTLDGDYVRLAAADRIAF